MANTTQRRSKSPWCISCRPTASRCPTGVSAHAYLCRRAELFHARELQGQSTLEVILHPKPFVSELTTAQLRSGDANAIFFRTMREADGRLGVSRKKGDAFPILLVLSEINWRPLDDFYRLKRQEGKLVFEGNYNQREHFPGAASGGSRASYLADRRVGWALVSADGSRVPYRGSDCVVYHEGLGHTVGLPHPEPQNGSVMSLGQYRGWLNESWLDKEQKSRLGWHPDTKDDDTDAQLDLFTKFRALPQPQVPSPGQNVTLALDWPDKANVKTLKVRLQTSIDGPWVDVPQNWKGEAPQTANLGTFDRPTPVSYRIDAELQGGATAELWGYLQVRSDPKQNPQPFALSLDLIEPSRDNSSMDEIATLPKTEIDLLKIVDPKSCWQVGEWSKDAGKLLSPKRFGAKLELPYTPPDEYRLSLIFEPLDEPNGLILGQRSGKNRFVTLINYTPESVGLSAIENVDGRNVGNPTTFTGALLHKDRPSQAIVTVTRRAVTVSVDGRMVVDWQGEPSRLSLSDYWKTPNESTLFLGTYNCRYRFHRITLEPITGNGTILTSLSED